MSIVDEIQKIRTEFESDLKSLSSDNGDLKKIRSKFIGRKGLIAGLFSQMGEVSNKERPQFGKELNILKVELTRKIDGLGLNVKDPVEKGSNIDLTLPGDPFLVGSIHPLTELLDEIKKIFNRIGFSVFQSAEIDTEFYNFEALNIPKHHPARDMQDTFYITDEVLLRTHTSDAQIHFMQQQVL